MKSKDALLEQRITLLKRLAECANEIKRIDDQLKLTDASLWAAPVLFYSSPNPSLERAKARTVRIALTAARASSRVANSPG